MKLKHFPIHLYLDFCRISLLIANLTWKWMTKISNCRKGETGMGWALSIIQRAATWLPVENYDELMLCEGAKSHHSWEQHSGQLNLLGSKSDCEINHVHSRWWFLPDEVQEQKRFCSTLGSWCAGVPRIPFMQTSQLALLSSFQTQVKWDFRYIIVSWRMFLI